MKKNIVLAMTFLLTVLFLTGCVSENTRSTILSKMESHNIIQDDWRYLDFDSQNSSPIPDIYRYNYYYEDADDIIYKIAIEGSVAKNDEHELYYPVTVYDNLEAYEAQERYTDPQTHTVKTRTITQYAETDSSACIRYRVYRRKFLFFNLWEIEERA